MVCAEASWLFQADEEAEADSSTCKLPWLVEQSLVCTVNRVSVAAATTVDEIKAAAATIPNKTRASKQATGLVNNPFIFVSDLIVSDKQSK
jgi:hypothetical protein